MASAILDINNREELKLLYPQISSLFEKCFGRRLIKDIWNWAYIDNPFGSPCVSIAVDKDTIVGHYATIPVQLSKLNGSSLNASLSMTTMVSKDYVRENLFQQLAESVYSRLADQNCDLVYGYPNVNSKAGFKKRLGWKIEDPMVITSLSKKEYIETATYQEHFLGNKSFTLDVSNDQALAWRFNKPLSSIQLIDGALYKLYGNSLDLLQVVDHNAFESAGMDLKFYTLVPFSEKDSSLSAPSKPSQYFSGQKNLLNSGFVPIFHQMSCSDVF